MASRLRLRSPRAVVLAIVIVGVAGAMLVYRSGATIREQDRADYLGWERQVAAALERATAMHEGLPWLAARARSLDDDAAAEDLRVMLVRTRRTLQHAREEMLDVEIPSILHATASLYLEGVARDLQALSRLEQLAGSPEAPSGDALAAYEDAYAQASEQYAEAAAAHARLRERLRLPVG